MTREEIIEMAKQAGFVDYELDDGTTDACDKRYEAFAKLVAKRTWVELTDDEIWEAYMESPMELDCSIDELYAISRTVEAKLKERNT